MFKLPNGGPDSMLYEKISFYKERGRSNWHLCHDFWWRTRHLTPHGARILSLPCQQQLIELFLTETYVQSWHWSFTSTELDPPTVRRGRQHLFISYAKGYSKEIATTTISRWIISTIKLAYQLTGNSQSLLRLSSISAHEVRALPTSWAMYKGVTLHEIMQAVEWKSHTIFSQFYFRDCWTLAVI
jgi:hypothetical protein